MAALAYITPIPAALAPSVVIEGRRQRIEDMIEWLLSLLDSADPDPDLEPSFCGRTASAPPEYRDPRFDECESDGGFEPNFATTEYEDATGNYAGPKGLWLASMMEEAEIVCEDEGAQCDDEGEPNDSGLGDMSGGIEQGYPPIDGIRAVI